ncbi:unnamed protein product [Ixodes pacificus]
MAGGTIPRLGKWFWNDDLWLPPNMTWEDVVGRGDGAKHARCEDLYYGGLVAILLLVIRYMLEKRAFRPLGVRLGIKDRGANHRRPQEEHVFMKTFTANRRTMTQEQARLLATELHVTVRCVQLWVHQRTTQEKKLARFSETAWRFLFYAHIFCYGLYVLWDKPWLWDTMHCWYDFPYHPVADGIWWYYMIQLGFYTSCTASHFVSTKRRDFWTMFAHHVVTITLLCLSWSCNLHRVGSLVLIVHDFADVPLEVARMARYVNRQRVADATFFLFTISWLVSRLGLYPYRVVYSAVFEAVTIVGMSSAYHVFCSLLLALQFMHVFWTWMIIQAAMQAIRDRGIKRLGSDDESSGDEDLTNPREAYQTGDNKEREAKTEKVD